jgi:hypothetical protein
MHCTAEEIGAHPKHPRSGLLRDLAPVTGHFYFSGERPAAFSGVTARGLFNTMRFEELKRLAEKFQLPLPDVDRSRGYRSRRRGGASVLGRRSIVRAGGLASLLA